jgi:LAO/AO transport system kinase
VADVFVVNKADRSGADKLRQEIEVMLGIRRGNAFRNVPAHHGIKNVTLTPSNARGRGPKLDRAPAPSAPAGPKGDIGWEQPVLVTAAVKGDGITDLVSALDRHNEWLVASGELDLRRRRRLLERTREVVERATRRWLWEETRAEQLISDRLDEVAGGRLSPYELAAEVVEELKQGERI